jgi:hypothetical protein
MQLRHSRNSWTFSHGFNMMVDFCVWVLEVDGLHVPPFDAHADGDGSLRAAGMNTENWQRWLIQVVQLQHEQDLFFRKNRSKETVQEKMALYSSEVYNPPLAWQGNDEVRQRLLALWEHYGKVSNGRKAWEQPLARAWQKDERQIGKRLYDQLQPYHQRIEPIAIHLVAYQQPLIYLIPPVSVVMSASQGRPDAGEFRTRVLEAAAGLSNYVPKNWASTPVFSVWSLQAAQPNQQFTIKYKTYPTRSLAPPAARKQPPFVADPIKQYIFSYLNDERHFDEIDWQTVKFRHDKDVSDWHVSWVSFVMVDGEQYKHTFVMYQEQDGRWRIMHASGGLIASQRWADLFAPVHDHPQIFLSGSKGTMPLPLSNDNGKNRQRGKYEFLAEGEVIDNGFKVTRVRLSNRQGLIFEEPVEDGEVFFAALGLEQDVEWPMQAQLYDQHDKLVWQQPVFDNRLPPGFKRP